MEYRLVRNDELYHHGVKGMKWGVRNDKRPSGARAKAALGKAASVARSMAKTASDSANRGDGGIVSKPKGTPNGAMGEHQTKRMPNGAKGERNGKVSLNLRSKNSTYRRYGKGNTPSGGTRAVTRSDNFRAKLANPKTKETAKKGAKIAAKVLGGAALTYAVVKIPNTKAYIKGASVVAEKVVKPIPGTKYLYRQAKLADNINRASDYASKGLAAAMIGGTAYKAGKKYKVVERNQRRGR